MKPERAFPWIYLGLTAIPPIIGGALILRHHIKRKKMENTARLFSIKLLQEAGVPAKDAVINTERAIDYHKTFAPDLPPNPIIVSQLAMTLHQYGGTLPMETIRTLSETGIEAGKVLYGKVQTARNLAADLAALTRAYGYAYYGPGYLNILPTEAYSPVG